MFSEAISSICAHWRAVSLSRTARTDGSVSARERETWAAGSSISREPAGNVGGLPWPQEERRIFQWQFGVPVPGLADLVLLGTGHRIDRSPGISRAAPACRGSDRVRLGSRRWWIGVPGKLRNAHCCATISGRGSVRPRSRPACCADPHVAQSGMRLGGHAFSFDGKGGGQLQRLYALVKPRCFFYGLAIGAQSADPGGMTRDKAEMPHPRHVRIRPVSVPSAGCAAYRPHRRHRSWPRTPLRPPQPRRDRQSGPPLRA